MGAHACAAPHPTSTACCSRPQEAWCKKAPLLPDLIAQYQPQAVLPAALPPPPPPLPALLLAPLLELADQVGAMLQNQHQVRWQLWLCPLGLGLLWQFKLAVQNGGDWFKAQQVALCCQQRYGLWLQLRGLDYLGKQFTAMCGCRLRPCRSLAVDLWQMESLMDFARMFVSLRCYMKLLVGRNIYRWWLDGVWHSYLSARRASCATRDSSAPRV
jgi:hypothetical protein